MATLNKKIPDILTDEEIKHLPPEDLENLFNEHLSYYTSLGADSDVVFNFIQVVSIIYNHLVKTELNRRKGKEAVA